MNKYAVAVAFAGSLLAAPAFSQDATSCTTMLSDFDAHLVANNIEATDERVIQARTEAEQTCLAGDVTAAEASLDNAVAELGIPPRTSGEAIGGDTGSTESSDQSGAADTTGASDTAGEASSSDTQSGTESGSSTTQ